MNQNVLKIFFEQDRESTGHCEKPRISVGVVVARRVVNDETDIFGEIGRCCVIADFQSFTNSLQVHWNDNVIRVVRYIQNADRLAEWNRIFRLIQNIQ